MQLEEFTLVIDKRERDYLGYVKELPIINFIGKSGLDVERNLVKCLEDVLESEWQVHLELCA